MNFIKEIKKYSYKIKLLNNQHGGKNNQQEPFLENLESLTTSNDNYRKIIYTTSNKQMQLVLMSLNPGEEIGMEIHDNVDQFFRIDGGEGKIIYEYDGRLIEKVLKDGDGLIIPAGTYHNIIAGDRKLKLYTIYTPANHPSDHLETTKQIEQN